MAPKINVNPTLCHSSDDYFHEEEEGVAISDIKDSHNVGRRLWKSITEQTVITTEEENASRLHAALSSIRILDCSERNQAWLLEFDGRLQDAPLQVVQALKERAPANFTARVADFNENLLYEMQPQRGLGHMGMSSHTLDKLLGANEYLGSFLTTETSVPQPPHVDYTWEILEQYSPEDLKNAFFPLTREGMFLQVWSRNDSAEQILGQIIYVPYGKLLTLPAHTIHGGGYRTTPLYAGTNGNLRFHLYVARNQACVPVHQTNKYTEPNNKGKELSWRYVDAPRMKDLLECLFV